MVNLIPIAGKLLTMGLPMLAEKFAKSDNEAVRKAIKAVTGGNTTPEAFLDKIASDGEALAKVRKYEAELQIEKEKTQQVAITEQETTARVALTAVDVVIRWARPVNAWALGIECLLIVIVTLMVAAFGEPDGIAHISEAIRSMGVPMGIQASLAGLHNVGRTIEKVKGVTK